MTSTTLMKTIFNHQLLLSQAIRVRLGDYLTSDLEQKFDESERFLTTMTKKDDHSEKDLRQLESLWKKLNQDLQGVRQSLKEGSEEKEDAAKVLSHLVPA